jgi:uncharacterized protein
MVAVAFEYDGDKHRSNIVKHGIGLNAAAAFKFDTAKISPDTRRDYGEERSMAYGFIGDMLYALVFTMRGSTMRLISLRKANSKERKRYHEQT